MVALSIELRDKKERIGMIFKFKLIITAKSTIESGKNEDFKLYITSSKPQKPKLNNTKHLDYPAPASPPYKLKSL